MQQGSDNIYNWRIYEKILLGFASAYGWFPVIWAFFLPDIMALLGWIISLFSTIEGSPFMETVFLSYIIACGIIYAVVFGGLAYVFPKIYILPAGILNLYFFYLGMQKIILSIVFSDDLDKFYHFESGEDRFLYFSSRDVYMTVFDLVFLIVLLRPALFYFHLVIRRLVRAVTGGIYR